MELHHKLRGIFQSLAVEQSKKFQQAVHSALNKLICNYGSHAKVGVCSLVYGRGRGREGSTKECVNCSPKV